MTPTTPTDPAAPARPAPTRRELRRVRRWLWRFDLAMQDYPSRERRRIVRDLRAALLDDTARLGADTALREIGHPWRVAAEHLGALGAARPRWNDGAVLAALLGFALPLYMWVAWSFGALDAIDAMGGGTVELTWLGVPMTLEHTDDAMGVAFRLAWQPVVVSVALGLLGFALGARVWRLWRDVPTA